MSLKKKIVLVIFSLTILSNISFSKENKILFKIDNEIITTIDIFDEIKYLSIINSEFKNTDKNLKIEIAKNSLIREKVKKIELNKFNLNFQPEDKLFMQIIQNNFNYLKIDNIDEFNLFFKENNLDPLSIKKKILNEIMWKQLIYNKFIEKVIINEKQIERNILSKKIQREYLLSEILVEADEKSGLEKKFELINQTIKEKNFSIAALNYSISDTSKNGGKLGWIKENALSQIIKKQLNFKKKGEITNPITIPGGFLILKIEDVKETEKKLDLNKEIKNIIEKQKNEQLNMYSNIYFNKLKKNVKINEF